MITATNIFGSSSCTTPLAIAGSSLSNTCTNSTVCTATQRSAIVVNTTTTCLAQPTSSDYAASVLGKSTYVGVVIYADVACSTEVASRFVIADGSCVAGPGTSYKATVGSGKGTFATYGTTDCSGNTASWDGPFVTTKCGSGASALTGYLVVVAGNTIVSSAAPRGVSLVGAVCAALGIVAVSML